MWRDGLQSGDEIFLFFQTRFARPYFKSFLETSLFLKEDINVGIVYYFKAATLFKESNLGTLQVSF